MTTTIEVNSNAGNEIDQINAINQPLLQSLNTGQHSQAAIRATISQITKQTIDDSVEIRLPFFTDFGRNIHLGKEVFINSGVTLVDLGGIYLADKVLIGPKANIISVNHPLDPANRRNVELKPVYVHENAWIGANATILPGVSIGRNAVVAAGAVVTKNVPANTVVADVPARVIKTIK